MCVSALLLMPAPRQRAARSAGVAELGPSAPSEPPPRAGPAARAHDPSPGLHEYPAGMNIHRRLLCVGAAGVTRDPGVACSPWRGHHAATRRRRPTPEVARSVLKPTGPARPRIQEWVFVVGRPRCFCSGEGTVLVVAGWPVGSFVGSIAAGSRLLLEGWARLKAGRV